MNARQKVKNLKKKISTLKSDNDLMRRIIADSPTMQELYDTYNNPVRAIHHTTIHFSKYRSKRFLDPSRPYDGAIIALSKRRLENDLFDVVKKNITYEIDAECMIPTITASIFVGESEEKE